MKQDKGKKKVIISTGKVVETTGLMLPSTKTHWLIEVKFKNGVKCWYYERELDNYIS